MIDRHDHTEHHHEQMYYHSGSIDHYNMSMYHYSRQMQHHNRRCMCIRVGITLVFVWVYGQCYVHVYVYMYTCIDMDMCGLHTQLSMPAWRGWYSRWCAGTPCGHGLIQPAVAGLIQPVVYMNTCLCTGICACTLAVPLACVCAWTYV